MTQSLGSSGRVPSGPQFYMVIKAPPVAVLSVTQHHKTYPSVNVCWTLFWGWR